MRNHTITALWEEIPDDADDLVLVSGGFRIYVCLCGKQLPDRTAAELHAMETGQCTTCLGTKVEHIVPDYAQDCTACAGTGRRGTQLRWQLAHAEAEAAITVETVRAVIAPLSGPFRLSEVADAVRDALGLPVGRMPVGPRVRDILRRLETEGELILVSAPDRMLRGTGVVLYRDPSWEHATAG
ncbi:hypothetical protein GCM10010156_76210 [Planobispora rosea]|uniref:Uncharacterized protein n=1 Tax=Planobispora rosea TaxID=35762 RepID=A0A8J3SAQ1_PLARO|nr:hypothetical protein [Planobispora rosea]GGT07764.1 hypothetical protein GCM10010156_76210 [Planobispora rosea]GIH89155.1 hypothetical protein Pro02_75630 [Planobispora rosea]